MTGLPASVAAVMALACLLGGVASPMPGRDDPVSYLSLAVPDLAR
jgi:hypothetical protein